MKENYKTYKYTVTMNYWNKLGLYCQEIPTLCSASYFRFYQKNLLPKILKSKYNFANKLQLPTLH